MEEKKTHHISLAAATAIVVASMVGTGVFTSLGWQLGGLPTGFPVLLLWGVGGIVALCGALSYAELTSMMPRSGGEYHLLGQAYHPLVGFLAGWVSVTAGFSAPIALAAIAFGKYATGVWPGTVGPLYDYLHHALPIAWTTTWPAVIPALSDRFAAFAVVALLTVLQLGGVRFIAKFQLSLTILRVLLIVAFIVGAFWFTKHPFDWNLLKPAPGDQAHVLSDAFATSLFYVMYAYAGWNGAVYVAGDMKNAQRNLPLALLLGTLIVMVLYIGLNAVFLMGGNWNDMRNQEDVGLIAARGIFSESGSLWMGGLIAFGLLSTVNAMLWTGAATLRVIGKDMAAVCWLDASDRRGEPVGAVLFMTNLVLLLLGTSSFQALLDYISALLQLSSLLAVFAVIWWRFRFPKRERPFKVPLYPLPPLIFITVSVWMLYVMVQKKPWETAWGAATLIVGVILYVLSPKKPNGERAVSELSDPKPLP